MILYINHAEATRSNLKGPKFQKKIIGGAFPHTSQCASHTGLPMMDSSLFPTLQNETLHAATKSAYTLGVIKIYGLGLTFLVYGRIICMSMN